MTHPSPCVSVIIPIYNVESYLEQCLTSVATQSCKDIEIICVIDGATDGSEDIARAFAGHESRCRVIMQNNQGLSVARNTGVEAATGQWIFFLDSDDWLAENALQKLVRAAGDRNTVVSGAVMEYWQEAGAHKPYKSPEKRPTGNLHLHRDNFFSLETVVWNKLYPREWVRQCSFVPGLIHEDLDFYWRFFSTHPQVHAIPDTVVHYRRRPGTLSRQLSCDQYYQDNYIRIVDAAFTAVGVHRCLEYQARRQSLKYLRYLREKSAPCERYESHIRLKYGVHDTQLYQFCLKLKKLLKYY